MISRMTEAMIHFYKGSVRDIEHFLKVHAYARLIGRLEGLDRETQDILEMAAVVHDISCPILRERFGNANGKLQEEMSGEILAPFLDAFEIPMEVKERLLFLVSHHHTVTSVDGMDYQILLEADFLVNAKEGNMTKDAIQAFCDHTVKTAAGKRLFDSMYLGKEQ
ncbi:MAG: phosphohydrolase [Clostridia bacterium]|nr:phosphohydrolase [Clostridia bacterium]